nr:carboxyl transferase domain-containing protein [uncultured Cellulosilyticum sp.]
MSTLEKLSELESRRTTIVMKRNEEAKKAALAQGKLTARDRIDALLDENSFVEIGAFVASRSTAFNMTEVDTPADGVVTGYGTVNGNPVYVYSQDSSVLGGAIGEMHAKKIVRIYEDALKIGAPVVGFLDTVGVRLQENIDALLGYGEIFSKMTEASSVIPQIAVVVGDCAGGASFIAGLSDFVFMSSKSARVFLNSPNTLDSKEASFENIATAKVHFEETGLANFIADKEETLIEEVRKLLSYLPQSNSDEVPFYAVTDDINRVEASLNNFDFETQSVKDIVIAVADNGEYLEIGAAYGKSAFTAFMRLDGGTVGVIANAEAKLDDASIKKVTSFVGICDDFNVPVVTFTNIEGFESTVATEKGGIVKAASLLVKAFASASIPKVNVLIGEGYGSSFVAMNSKSIGADMVYAWPTAKIGSLKSESAMKIMYGKELESGAMSVEAYTAAVAEYEAMHGSAFAAAQKGMVDDIIEPAATRKRIIAALEVLATKVR